MAKITSFLTGEEFTGRNVKRVEDFRTQLVNQNIISENEDVVLISKEDLQNKNIEINNDLPSVEIWCAKDNDSNEFHNKTFYSASLFSELQEELNQEKNLDMSKEDLEELKKAKQRQKLEEERRLREAQEIEEHIDNHIISKTLVNNPEEEIINLPETYKTPHFSITNAKEKKQEIEENISGQNFSLNQSKTVYDELPDLFNKLYNDEKLQKFQKEFTPIGDQPLFKKTTNIVNAINNKVIKQSIGQTKPWDFRFQGKIIGEVYPDGNIALFHGSIEKYGLDVKLIKDAINSSQFAKSPNFKIRTYGGEGLGINLKTLAQGTNLDYLVDKHVDPYHNKMYEKLYEKDKANKKTKDEKTIESENQNYENDKTLVAEDNHAIENSNNQENEISEKNKIEEEINPEEIPNYDETIEVDNNQSITNDELENISQEITDKDLKRENTFNDLVNKISDCDEQQLINLLNSAKEQNISSNELANFKDENNNNILHLAAKNPNLTQNSLILLQANLGKENVKKLYFEKNNEEQIPLETARLTNVDDLNKINFETKFSDKKQTLDVSKTFALMTMATNTTFEENKNSFSSDKSTEIQKTIDKTLVAALGDQMNKRKELIEQWNFKNEETGITQSFQKENSIVEKEKQRIIHSYNFINTDENSKTVIDSIKLSENRNGLSILESSNQNLTNLVERNFKIQKDKDYSIVKDISQKPFFLEQQNKNEPAKLYKEFPQDFMEKNNFFPPMYVDENKNIFIKGKDEFNNDCIYKANEKQMTNIIDNSITYAQKDGKKVDFSKNENVIPKAHSDFIKSQNNNADVSSSYRKSLDIFKDNHSNNILSPFKADKAFEQKMAQEERLEQAKKIAYERGQKLGDIKR